MNILKKFNLKDLTTFGIDAFTKQLLIIEKDEDLETLPEFISSDKSLILGGGSNYLFTKDFDGVVLHPEIKGIKVIEETDEHITLAVKSGEIWDDFVEYCVRNNYGGIENLSDIPGQAGASPIQNIGAYGCEVRDTILSVHGMFLETGKWKTFTNAECDFSYLTSIFKAEFKNQFFVTEVAYQLSKKNHKLVTHYGSVSEYFQDGKEITPRTIREAIKQIRASKLPDPEEYGNAGSFFKNPVISTEKAEKLQKQHPDIPLYPQNEKQVKTAAGWLIDQAGWKGKSKGNAAVHSKQALVLINKGEAKGKEIFQLAYSIIEDVQQKFDIQLEPEVNII
ncbi:MAG: UDP-N-acetylenolpyruvoylglucosamine reductase [Marinilabiliales bacterium]|nr:MAG: UDP-N-acetylenolpyruvoylglucosamine reductase [Marinilabiliales bacterium]